MQITAEMFDLMNKPPVYIQMPPDVKRKLFKEMKDDIIP
jgi:hypothetical protein